MISSSALTNLAEDAYKQLLSVFPDAHQIHPHPALLNSVNTAISGSLTSASKIEKDAIFEKLSETASATKKSLSVEYLLYLEQQVSDLFGIAVTGELLGERLPFITGRILAGPQLPTQIQRETTGLEELSAPESLPHRGFFGWHGPKYGVSLPLHLLPSWIKASEKDRLQLKDTLVLVVNSSKQIGVIAQLQDVAPLYAQRYQLVGSPSLITEGGFWTPGSSGMASFFFIEKSSEVAVLGPVTC